MECEYVLKNNVLRILVPGELDHHVASQIQEETDLLVGTYFIHRIVFDFKNTEFMDSSGIGMIMGRYKNLRFMGGAVMAVHVNERIRRILTMSGIYKVIDIYEGLPQQSGLL